MKILTLVGFFGVTQYQLYDQSATVRLVDNNIVVKAQYVFRNVLGQQKGLTADVNMLVTPAQSDDLKAILAQVLQATNTEIELQTGWTKWIEPEEKQ